MSRSALTRVEMQQALASRATATTNPMVHAIYPGTAMMQVPVDPYYVEEARRVKENQLPIHGNQTTYNFNTLLYDNVMNSDYFRKLYELATYHEVVDEIYYRVDHAEPWAAGTSRIPSTCFCLLMKFCTMRLTVNQMQGLLKHVDSPFIRCVGFLYLRYTCDPELLWEWYEPFLDDEEEFNASSNDAILTTMGAWIRSLLEDLNYFNTILPRIPKKIQDGIKVKLLLHGQKKQRQAANLAIVEYLVKGTKVKAMYTDEDHPPAMYDAVIDEVDDVTHEYWVTFPEYGNTEKVSLGDIAFEKPAPPPSKSKRSRSISRSRDRHHHRSSRRRDRSTSRPRDRHRSSRRSPSEERSRHRHHRHARRGSSRSRSRSRERKDASGALTDDLMAQVREQERRKAEAVGKDYAARPASYKGSLSLKQDRFTTRKRSRSPAKRDVEFVELEKPKEGTLATTSSRPVQMSREAEERRRKLVETYGDAASKSKPAMSSSSFA